jgi:hypothetical protein
MVRFITALLLLIACQSASAAACSEKSFLEFFTKCAVDPEFSQQRTLWPLRITTESFGAPETRQSKVITSRTDHWGIKKPIFDFLRENPGMGVSVFAKTKSNVVLTFGIEDADIVFDLKFSKRRGCWELVEIRDFER